MKKLIARLTLSLIAPQLILSNAFAQGSLNNSAVDLKEKLELREKFYTDFLEVQRDMNDIAKGEALKAWYGLKEKEFNKNLKKTGYVAWVGKSLDQYVKSQKVIEWAGHYQLTNQQVKTGKLLASYAYMLAAYVDEVATDPRADKNMIPKVYREAKDLSESSVAAAKAAHTCLTGAAAGSEASLNGLTSLAQKCLGGQVQTMANFVNDTLNNKYFTGSNQVLSLTGLIGGNKVEQLLENFYEPAFIKYMAPMSHAVINNYANKGADGKLTPWTVAEFKEKMKSKQSALTDFFTQAEGFPASARNHEVWGDTKEFVGQPDKKNIYGQVMNAIDSAKQSVFIDVFFIGGSIGATLAKRLIEKVQENKNFWVYIINDRNNPLGYNNEMAPVYNYLRAYAEKFSEDRIVLVAPQVELKRTAFPAIADLLLKDATILSALDSTKDFAGQLSFYPKGKSDHSKVIVVDGLDKKDGVAFVGSKNFTDSSGGVAYDEVTKIQGPAVPAILDSYYQDLTLALKQLQGGSPFSNPEYLADLYESNFKDGEKNVDVQIKKILAKVDVLNRSKLSGVTDLNWPSQGTTPLMIGENNSYGTIRTALPQVIAGIRSADKQIIISEQFIYEPSVVRALKEQVSKKIGNNPNFRVYILLADMADHFNPLKEFSHIPNVSFVDEFTGADSKIQVKWKKVPAAGLQALTEVKNSHGLSYAPEYHLKSLSIDGVTAAEANQCGNKAALAAGLAATAPNKLPLLISGSANKDVMTMTGGFREYQVVIYDRATTVDHDCQFWSRFNNSDQSVAVDPSTMNLPAKIKAKGLNESRFNQLVRDIVNGAYNIETGFFN